MAIIKNRKTLYNEEIGSLNKEKHEIDVQIENFGKTDAMDVETQKPSTLEELQTKQIEIAQKIEELTHNISAEEDKVKNWKIENIRRKHNYIPFFVNLLKILAEKGELVPLIQKASKKF